mmetsp:Transcript_14411/g.47327  ORF Transcript_14411/g.47327 Transcript_14411/m.47327 type:complete len:211 (-) Transcript_14411:115-747(-)
MGTRTRRGGSRLPSSGARCSVDKPSEPSSPSGGVGAAEHSTDLPQIGNAHDCARGLHPCDRRGRCVAAVRGATSRARRRATAVGDGGTTREHSWHWRWRPRWAPGRPAAGADVHLSCGRLLQHCRGGSRHDVHLLRAPRRGRGAFARPKEEGQGRPRRPRTCAVALRSGDVHYNGLRHEQRRGHSRSRLGRGPAPLRRHECRLQGVVSVA